MSVEFDIRANLLD